MRHRRLSIVLLPGRYAVCRLAPDAAIPSGADGHLLSITRTADELSIVCDENTVPAGARREPGWRCLRVAGTLEFSLVGVMASLVVPLAEADVAVFVFSTFDTDYFMVRELDLDRAVTALRGAGHEVEAVMGP
jgi:hypothetical protein